ncbi:nucleic acid binding, partial [Striga asiatica]
MTCQNCLRKGHNKTTCKNEPVQKPEKKKRGRPKKTVDSSDTSSFQKRPKLPVKRNVNSIVQKERAMKVHFISSTNMPAARASSSGRKDTRETGVESGTSSVVESESNIGTQSSA